MSAEVVEHIGPGLKEIYALANILVVAAIIYFGARKGIAASLRDRSESIAKKLSETKNELARIKLEVEKARQDFAGLAQTKSQILNQVENEGRLLSAQLVQEAQKTAEKILTDAKQTAQNEFQQASQKLREKLVSEAVRQSADLVRAEKNETGNLRERIHERLFDKFLTEVEKEQR